METATVVKAHFENIEPIITKLIREAKESVYIVMAWLTSNGIKRVLLQAKRRNPGLHIGIVVDENETNQQYFLDFEDDFKTNGIDIRKKLDSRF